MRRHAVRVAEHAEQRTSGSGGGPLFRVLPGRRRVGRAQEVGPQSTGLVAKACWVSDRLIAEGVSGEYSMV